MAIVQVMLVKGTSPWSYLIKRLTRSPYSHVCFAIDGKTYEMDFGGYYCRPVETYAWAYDLFDLKGVGEPETQLLLSWIDIHKGAAYDYMRVIWQGLVTLGHVTRVRSLLESKKAFSCVEWVCSGLAAINRPLMSIDQDTAYPGDFPLDPRLSYVRSVPAYRKVA